MPTAPLDITTPVFASGTALAIRLPRKIEQALGLRKGDLVHIHVRDDQQLVISRTDPTTGSLALDYAVRRVFTARWSHREEIADQRVVVPALQEPIDSIPYRTISRLCGPGAMRVRLSKTEKVTLRNWLQQHGLSQAITIRSDMILALDTRMRETDHTPVRLNSIDLLDLMGHSAIDWIDTLDVDERYSAQIIAAANAGADAMKNHLSTHYDRAILIDPDADPLLP